VFLAHQTPALIAPAPPIAAVGSPPGEIPAPWGQEPGINRAMADR
jgi:hypothetical protein